MLDLKLFAVNAPFTVCRVANDTAWGIPSCTHACIVCRVHACAYKEVEQMRRSVDMVGITLIKACLRLPSGQENLGYSFRANSSITFYTMSECNFHNYFFLGLRHTECVCEVSLKRA